MTETRPTRSRRLFTGLTLILTAILAAALGGNPTAAQGTGFGTAFSVRSDGDDQLYRVNLQTAAAVAVGPVGFVDVEGLTFSPTGVLFGVDDETDVLITINTTTGAGTVVGPLGVDVEDIGLSFGPGDRLFMTAFDGGTGSESFFEVNPNTGAALFVGILDQPVTGLASDPVGTLFGLGGGFFNNLVMIDPVTGLTAPIGPLVNEIVAQGGLDFDIASEQLFGIHDGGFDGDPLGPPSELFTVNETTGAATVVGPVTVTGTPTPGFESLAILTQADLSVVKTDSADPAPVGQPLTYTLQVTNNGPDRTTGVVLTDVLPAGVSFVSANPPPTTSVGGTLTWDLGSLVSGAGRTVTVTVTPTAPGTLNNSAAVTGDAVDPNIANNSDTEQTTIQLRADLVLTKSDAPDPVNVGDLLTYTLQVSNNGPNDATGVRLTDTLPAGVTFVNSTPAPTTNVGGTLTYDLGALASGASSIVTVGVRPTTAGTITNFAVVTGNETDPNTGNNTASAATTVQIQTDLVLTKSDAPDPATVGQPLIYTLRVTNNGPNDATGVRITDPLPAGVTFVSSTPPPTTNAAGTLTYDLGTVANGASRTVSVIVTPTAAGTVTNTASVAANEADSNAVNNADSEDTTVQPAPAGQADLSLTKSDAPDPATVGQPLIYTLRVTNNGPNDATNARITDPLPAGVTFVSATPDPTTNVGGTLTFDLGTIAAGANRTVTVTVTPTQAGTLVNSAVVSGAEGDPSTANNAATVETTVQVRADLALTKSDSPDPATVGQPLVYTIQVTNNGPNGATGVTVTDSLPAGVTFVNSTPAPTTNAGGTLTFDLGSVASGASRTLTVTVTPTAAGTLSNTASVAGNEQDPNGSNNSDSEDTTVRPAAAGEADLALTKTDSQDPVQVGQGLTYTLRVTNSGPAAATGVTLTDPLPTGAQFVSASPAPTSNAGGTLTFDLGTIPSGGSRTVTVTVNVTQAGTLVNTATVAGNETDPGGNNNSATAVTTVQGAPTECSGQIRLSRRQLHFGSVRVGRTARRTLTITNRSFTQNLRVQISDPTGPFEVALGARQYTLRPRQALIFSVIFAPDAAGAAEGELLIESSDCQTPQVTVSLDGTGGRGRKKR